jgi:uncharacterized protein involved in exopolysaccharide biosynthesis
LIAKQYEAARLDESRDAPILQVIDRAVVPEVTSGLPRLVLILIATIVGAILGVAWIVANSVFRRYKNEREVKLESH